jgi:hypothetical protein
MSRSEAGSEHPLPFRTAGRSIHRPEFRDPFKSERFLFLPLYLLAAWRKPIRSAKSSSALVRRGIGLLARFGAAEVLLESWNTLGTSELSTIRAVLKCEGWSPFDFRLGRCSPSRHNPKMSTAQFESIFQGLSSASGSELCSSTSSSPLVPLQPLQLSHRDATWEGERELTRFFLELRIAQSGLGWKSSDEKESVTTVPSSDIKWIQWIR